MEIKKVWDFVEAYYPNYSSCDEIMRNNDLSKAIENGDEDLENQMNDSNAYVYGKAIESYIEKLNNPVHTYFLFGSDGVRQYHDNGIEGVVESFLSDEGLTDGAIFEFVEGKTSIANFADALSGWFDYTEISKEEYEKLNS